MGRGGASEGFTVFTISRYGFERTIKTAAENNQKWYESGNTTFVYRFCNLKIVHRPETGAMTGARRVSRRWRRRADHVGEYQSMVEQVKSTANWQLLGVDEQHLPTCT